MTPVPSAGRSTRHSLPPEVASFVGREREIDEIARRLANGPDLTRCWSRERHRAWCGEPELFQEYDSEINGPPLV